MPGSARPSRAENRRLREENTQLRAQLTQLFRGREDGLSDEDALREVEAERAAMRAERNEVQEFEVEPWIPADAVEQLAKRLQELMIADNRATSGKAIERYAAGLVESPITGWLPAWPPDAEPTGDPPH